jgi:hypothetical protein
MFMDALNLKEAVKEAVEAIRKTPPVQRRKNAIYSIAARTGYDDIRQLRADGYGYDVICEVFAEKGVLQPNASPKNLSSAFLREMKRREKRAMAANTSNSAEAKKPTDMKAGNQVTQQKGTPDREKLIVNPDHTFNIRPNGLTESDVDAIEKKRVREMTGVKYKNAWGDTITKHTDGSFDFE